MGPRVVHMLGLAAPIYVLSGSLNGERRDDEVNILSPFCLIALVRHLWLFPVLLIFFALDVFSSSKSICAAQSIRGDSSD